MAAVSKFDRASKDASSVANPRRVRRSWPGRFALSGLLAAIASLGLACSIAAAEPEKPSTVEGSQLAPADATKVILSEEPSPKSPTISVSGTVTDESGEPLAGASVVLRAKLNTIQYSFAFPHERDVLARTKTDAEGRFKFSEIGFSPRMVEILDDLRQGKEGVQVLAWAEGYGLEWKPVASLGETQTAFRLQKEADVSGVILNEEGEPLEEGTVSATAFTKATDGIDGIYRGPGDLKLMRSEVEFRGTIRDGRFSIPNMPRDYRIAARVESASGHRTSFRIDTGNGTTKEIASVIPGRELDPVHRTPVRATAKRRASVRLKVVDHAGKPVAGGGVGASDSQRHYGGSAAVDEQGNAVLIVNQPGVHDLFYEGDPLRPVVGIMQKIDIQLGEIATVEIRLPASHPVTGRVLDSATGEPVVGVYVSGGVSVAGDQVDLPRPLGATAASDSDGRFELPSVEGDVSLSIRYPVDGYFVPMAYLSQEPGPKPTWPTVKLAPGEAPEEAIIRIGRGMMIEGTLVGPDGKPARGVKVTASHDEQPYRNTAAVTDAGGRFRLQGFSPYVPVRVIAADELGVAKVEVPATEDHPWEKTLTRNVDLKLAAGASLVGRVTREGRPTAGVNVRLHSWTTSKAGEDQLKPSLSGQTSTDEKGEYRFAGLKRGDQYMLEFDPQEGAEVRDRFFQRGSLHVVDVEDGKTIELPDAVLKRADQTLAGVVVDQDGNPLKGYSVAARYASGESVTASGFGPPPWTETDGEGRFRLTNLPDEPISLMAYKSNPGQPIRFPGHASPALNADDIRIVIDARLPNEPESLD